MFAIQKVLSLALILTLMACSDDKKFTVLGSDSSTVAVSNLVNLQNHLIAKPLRHVEGSPAVLTLNVLGAFLAVEADCSNLIAVEDLTSAQPRNLSAGPTLLAGDPADGSYNCIVLKISDTLSFTADATAIESHTLCVDGGSYQFDVYRTDIAETWKDSAGTDITATGTIGAPTADTIYVFGSTDKATISQTPFTNQAFTLSSALTVPGSITFYVDWKDLVTDEPPAFPIPNDCSVDLPATRGFGFR